MQQTVTNEQPRSFPPEQLPAALLQLFRDATRPELVPFEHQGESMLRVLADEQLFLVAGTAAGKTLAVATPLFFKLREGRIKKALFMYPTLALLEDQRRVLQQLAAASGLAEEVGRIQGGMSRSALIHNLNKRVLLATPDAIYWFFRKNVKYNALLVYGLCQVDEFVLDEAHLFNGLMLRNFEHLWQRVKTLTGLPGKTPRLHILTATPTVALRRLNGAESIKGRSKCSDVSVEFRACDWFDRAEHFIGAVNEVLEAGGRKILVVCNSARMAHQLFEKYKVRQKDASTIIPNEHLLRFAQVKLGDLIEWLIVFHNDRLHVFSQRGIGLQHLIKMLEQIEWTEHQPLYFFLLHGDVYLSRLDRDLTYVPPEPVRDREQNPLFIPDQTYLVLGGWTEKDGTRALLDAAGVAGWEELQCDWDRLGQDWNNLGMVLLEKTTGACFAAYKSLVDHVS